MRPSWSLLLALSTLPVPLSNCRTAVDWGSTAGGGSPAGSGGAIAGATTPGGAGSASDNGGAGSSGRDASSGAGHGGTGEGGQGEAGTGDAGALAGEPAAAAGAEATGGAGGNDALECTLECLRGTECTARGDTWACEFPTRSTWLAFESSTDSTVGAVRLSAGEELAPEILKPWAADRSIMEFAWSPSGRYFLFKEQWPDNPYDTSRSHDRWLWSYFGPGLPTKPRPLPNLPSSGQFGTPWWDEATDTLVLMNGRESYVVRFDGDRAESELAVSSDESYDVRPCRGASALLYSSDQTYLVPVGATPATERVPLGAYPGQSPDLSKVVGVRPGSSSGSQVLFIADCEVGAVTKDLLEIEGEFIGYEFWDNDSLLIRKSQGQNTILELVTVERPEEPVFSGEFTFAVRSGDYSLALLWSILPGARYHVLDLAGGVPEPLAIDNTAIVEWCGQHLLIHEPGRAQMLDPRSSAEPRALFPETGDELGPRICDSSGQYVAFARNVSNEPHLELFRLATPDSPPLIYPLGPRQVQITSFHADERGLIAALTGPESSIWWLPMPDGVPARAREVPSARDPALQPWP